MNTRFGGVLFAMAVSFESQRLRLASPPVVSRLRGAAQAEACGSGRRRNPFGNTGTAQAEACGPDCFPISARRF
jgi:hypothetical protein